MKRRVQWEREALDDFKAQIDYIAFENPNAARRVADRIQSAAASLGDMVAGRPGRVSGTHEKLVLRLPYIIAFEVTQMGEWEVVSILRIIHTSRNWPEEKWPA